METREKRKKLASSVQYRHFNVSIIPDLQLTHFDDDPIAFYTTIEEYSSYAVATVASVWDGERFYFGVALCSPTDNFSREEGRKRARRRLFEKGKLSGLFYADEESHKDYEDAVRCILDEIQPIDIQLVDDDPWYHIGDGDRVIIKPRYHKPYKKKEASHGQD